MGGGTTSSIILRHYTPMTPQQQEEEKARVAQLSAAAKEQELRHLNREISRLEMLRNINTGDLDSWRGRYKALARDYAAPIFVWYWTCFGATLASSYLLIDYGGVDVMGILVKLDQWTGYEISANVRPEYGKLGLALVLNEVLEVVRLPFVILTIKPIMDRLNPTKY